jgi:hypothetical protein
LSDRYEDVVSADGMPATWTLPTRFNPEYSTMPPLKSTVAIMFRCWNNNNMLQVDRHANQLWAQRMISNTYESILRVMTILHITSRQC